MVIATEFVDLARSFENIGIVTHPGETLTVGTFKSVPLPRNRTTARLEFTTVHCIPMIHWAPSSALKQYAVFLSSRQDAVRAGTSRRGQAQVEDWVGGRSGGADREIQYQGHRDKVRFHSKGS